MVILEFFFGGLPVCHIQALTDTVTIILHLHIMGFTHTIGFPHIEAHPLPFGNLAVRY